MRDTVSRSSNTDGGAIQRLAAWGSKYAHDRRSFIRVFGLYIFGGWMTVWNCALWFFYFLPEIGRQLDSSVGAMIRQDPGVILGWTLAVVATGPISGLVTGAMFWYLSRVFQRRLQARSAH